MDGTAVFQVTHHIDVQIIKRPLGLVDAVEVEHTLGGMLVGTVACVHNRDGGHLRGILSCTFDIVAHHDDVGIVGDHEDGVFQRLTLGAARDFRVGKSDNSGTKTVGCCLKTEPCACRRFKEKSGDHFPLQKFPVWMSFEFFSHLDHIEDFLLRQIGYCHKIPLFHSLI